MLWYNSLKACSNQYTAFSKCVGAVKFILKNYMGFKEGIVNVTDIKTLDWIKEHYTGCIANESMISLEGFYSLRNL